MRKEITFCDVCKKEEKVINKILPVIFLTEQTEGRSTEPYLTNESMDICDACYAIMMEGNFIYGKGAQGYNTFYFKKEK